MKIYHRVDLKFLVAMKLILSFANRTRAIYTLRMRGCLLNCIRTYSQTRTHNRARTRRHGDTCRSRVVAATCENQELVLRGLNYTQATSQDGNNLIIEHIIFN